MELIDINNKVRDGHFDVYVDKEFFFKLLLDQSIISVLSKRIKVYVIMNVILLV